MQTHGVPNDLLPSLNSLTIILIIPFLTNFLYPFLQRKGIGMGPLQRIVIGFLFEAASMAYAAGVQHWIYISPPCYLRPRACPASMNGSLPNEINIGIQVPVYILDGISEAFASPAGYDYAFTMAPKGMKSIVQALVSPTSHSLYTKPKSTLLNADNSIV